MRISIIWLITVLLLVQGSLATTVTLYSEDDSIFDGLLAIVTLEDKKLNVFIENENKVNVDGIGLATFQILSDKIYTGTGKLEEGNKILVRPTAKISGKVLDDRDNLLQHVPLKIICPMLSEVPETTDDFGFYNLESVGFGACEISAIVDGKVVTHEIMVNESRHYIVNFRVESATNSTNIMFFILTIILLAIIVYFAIKLFYKKSPMTTKKQKDIRTTLSKSEKMIVDQLCVCDNLTQSQLRHQTGLPKSTLHRVLTKLQNKNIIIYQEESGIKKVKLTDFFRK